MQIAVWARWAACTSLYQDLSIKPSKDYGKISLISTTSEEDTMVCSPFQTGSFPCWLQSIKLVPDESIQLIQKTPRGIHHIYLDTSHMRLADRILIRRLAINRWWANRLTDEVNHKLGGSEAFNCSGKTSHHWLYVFCCTCQLSWLWDILAVMSILIKQFFLSNIVGEFTILHLIPSVNNSLLSNTPLILQMRKSAVIYMTVVL